MGFNVSCKTVSLLSFEYHRKHEPDASFPLSIYSAPGRNVMKIALRIGQLYFEYPKVSQDK